MLNIVRQLLFCLKRQLLSPQSGSHLIFFSIFSDTFLFITNAVSLSCQSSKPLELKPTTSETRDDGFRMCSEFRASFFMYTYYKTHILIPGVHSVCKPCCWSAFREKDAEISSDLTQGEETLKHKVEIVLLVSIHPSSSL